LGILGSDRVYLHIFGYIHIRLLADIMAKKDAGIKKMNN
jgi:hypothetical protein